MTDEEVEQIEDHCRRCEESVEDPFAAVMYRALVYTHGLGAAFDGNTTRLSRFMTAIATAEYCFGPIHWRDAREWLLECWNLSPRKPTVQIAKQLSDLAERIGCFGPNPFESLN